MTTYEYCFANFIKFLNSLSYTSIDFMFFYAHDLSVPKIKSKFKLWNVDNIVYYISEGVQKNALYVYKKTHLQHLIKILPGQNAQCTQTENANTKKVNHGDHLDFQINKMKNSKVLVKTHFTQYTDILGDFTFSRDDPKCNFTLDESKVKNKSLDEFLKLNTCDDIKGQPLQKIKENTEYPEFVKKNVYSLCRILVDDTYNSSVNVKKNIKGGGNPMTYKSVQVMSTDYMQFLRQKIFANMVDTRKDLQSITMIYDSNNELTSKGSKNICGLYDFEDNTRNIFYIDVEISLVAMYAEQANGILTQYEKSCKNQFNTYVKNQTKELKQIAQRMYVM